MTIVDSIQEQVDKISKVKWENDTCPPEFIVSVLYEKDSHKIILTIEHLGKCFSTVLFPQLDMDYGYQDLEWEMTNIYNQTM